MLLLAAVAAAAAVAAPAAVAAVAAAAAAAAATVAPPLTMKVHCATLYSSAVVASHPVHDVVALRFAKL